MIRRWQDGRTITPHPSSLIHYNDPDAHPISDGDITFRGDYWLTHQHSDSFSYRELHTEHGVLIIRELALSQTIRCALYQLGQPLEEVVQLPAHCIVRAAEGKIIRATNRPDDSVELLMRIKCYTATMAWTRWRIEGR